MQIILNNNLMFEMKVLIRNTIIKQIIMFIICQLKCMNLCTLNILLMLSNLENYLLYRFYRQRLLYPLSSFRAIPSWLATSEGVTILLPYLLAGLLLENCYSRKVMFEQQSRSILVASLSDTF